MSALQDQAKLIVKQLADGGYPRLDKDDIEILARWCAMVSINLEHYSRIPVTTQNQRTTLMNGNMPPGWRVSIGILESNLMAGEHFTRVVGIPTEVGESEFVKMQSTYFCIEKAAFHTFVSHGDKTLELAILSSGLSTIENPLQQIWPNICEINLLASTGLRREDLIGIQQNLAPVEHRVFSR